MVIRTASRFQSIWNHTRKGRVLAVLALIFALVNVFIYVDYRNDTYERSSVNGQPVGRTPIDQLEQKLTSLPLLPDTITLTYQGKATTARTDDLGLRIDGKQTAQSLADSRSWLPIANLFIEHQAQLYLAVDPKAYERQINEIGKQYQRPAKDASLILRNNRFEIIPESNAQTLDISGTQANIINVLSAGGHQADLTMKQTPPAVTGSSLKARYDGLEAQRKTAITLSAPGKSKRLSPEDIGSWFVLQNSEYTVADVKVTNAISDAGLELGVNAINAASVATAVKQAVEAKKPASLTLEGRALGKRTYNYCTAGRGVPQADVDGMTAIINSTLTAKRGWSLSNNITFAKSETTCDFTIWLAAPDQMSSFGAICDAYWSCAVKPNVIFNWDRWRYTSEPWKKSGGNLADYQVMVINHEVGHWLGFNHSNCPVQGQPAPVMQQQSIDLQGCAFNPWPTATERTALRDYLGL